MQLGKVHKLFTNQQEVNGAISMPDVVVYIPDNGRANGR